MRRRSGGDKAPEFIRYEAHSSGALFNHGWKDSADAIVDEQGENVAGSVALSEVQAYAIDAARRFAKLLLEIEGEEAEAEAAVLRRWADELVSRFLEAFVVDDGPGEPYFAIALDRDDKAVKGLTSNIGHLLGTGILSPVQSAALARHLVSDELFSGWGVRTRSSAHPRFNRLSYHGGAVWAHDTAIAIRGLALAAAEAADAKDPVSARACGGAARTLAGGLIDAAHAFDYRLPELFGGGPREAGDIMPLPFPAACRPQAWSAAAGVAVYEALKRLDALDEVLVSS
jgi:glycogen debranching enzyme